MHFVSNIKCQAKRHMLKELKKLVQVSGTRFFIVCHPHYATATLVGHSDLSRSTIYVEVDFSVLSLTGSTGNFRDMLF